MGTSKEGINKLKETLNHFISVQKPQLQFLKKEKEKEKPVSAHTEVVNKNIKIHYDSTENS